MARRGKNKKESNTAARAAAPPGTAAAAEARSEWARVPDAVWFLLIVAVALLLRQAHVVQLTRSPLFEHPHLDEQIHDEWARAIVAGKPYMEPPYFRAPLYAWFLAGVYKACGGSYLAPRIVQAVLGSLSCGLLFLIGRDVFGRAVGVAAGLVAATYWVLIYFDGELLIASLLVFLDLLLIRSLLQADRRPGAWRMLGSGVVMGLSAIARPNILLFAPFAALWVFLRQRGRPRAAVGYVACLTAGTLMPILPVTVRNVMVGKDRVLISWQGGTNFYIGNNARSNGFVAVVPGTPGDWWGGYYATYALAEVALGRPLKPSEVSRYFYGLAMAWMREHPRDALVHMLRKLQMWWHHWEIPNNKDIYFWVERYAPLVKALPIGFGVVGPLGILGLVMCRRRAGELFPLWGFVLIYMCSFVAFFVNARFRVPTVPPLILLGAYAVFGLADAVRRREVRAVSGAAAVLVAATALVWLGPDTSSFRDDRSSYVGLGKSFELGGRFDEAIESYRSAARHDEPAQDATIRARLCYLLALRGEREEARSWCEEALRIEANEADAHSTLGGLLSETGAYAEAEAHFAAALAANDRHADAWYNRGLNELRQGNEAAGIAAFETCLRIDPAEHRARNNLGNVLAATGRLEEAVEQYRTMLRQVPESPEAHSNLGSALRELGRVEEAIAEYEAALAAAPGYTAAHRLLGRTLLEVGRAPEAVEHLAEAVRLEPGDVATRLDLAWVLATHPRAEVRDGRAARVLAEEAVRQLGRADAVALDVLAAAQAEAGDLARARETGERAAALAAEQGDEKLAEMIGARRREYEAGRAYRQSPETAGP